LRPLIARVHRYTVSIGGAGEFLLPVPHLDPNAGGSIFKRFHVFSAQMTNLRVERNGIKECDVTSALNSYNQMEYKRVPQANVFTYDPILDGLQEDRVLDTRPAARCTTAGVYGKFSAAETITIEVETLEPLDVY
jgi:hypothetical protein